MRLRFITVAASLAFAAACTPAPAPDTGKGSAEDEQAIRALTTAYVDAVNKHDPKAMAATVADDYEDVMPNGSHTQGRAGVEAQAAKDMADPSMNMPGATMSATTDYIHWLSSTSAFSGGTWNMTGLPAGAPSKGSWMSVVVKRDSTWKVVSSTGAVDVMAMMPVPDTTKKK